MDGWWDVKKLDEFIFRILRAKLEKVLNFSLPLAWLYIKSKFINRQSHSRAKEIAHKHYNLDNKLFFSFLDPYNQYICGYFKNTNDLNKAQEQKLDLICRKLQLKSNDKVLDIGCGWGGFAKYAASKYGCQVTGITISKQQLVYAKEFTTGLPVKILEMDYRDLQGRFDKILVCGMIEHVGYKNYKNLLQVVCRILSDEGTFLLHTIGRNTSATYTDPWIDKYIFPNGMIPSSKQLADSFENLFVVEDWHNFGVYYDQTLMSWFDKFKENWASIAENYDQRFFRMWKYYLLSCAGAFRAREMQLWQLVLTKKGAVAGYPEIR
jgi:cyclopropane-fatty-acyl-phospholipid synthase